jgi:hypothetical protein
MLLRQCQQHFTLLAVLDMASFADRENVAQNRWTNSKIQQTLVQPFLADLPHFVVYLEPYKTFYNHNLWIFVMS